MIVIFNAFTIKTIANYFLIEEGGGGGKDLSLKVK